MKTASTLLAIVLAAGALAGCTREDAQPTPTPTAPTPTSPTPTTPSPTPTTPTVPTVTPPTTPTTPTTPTVPPVVSTGTITAAYVVSLTDRVDQGGDADVCWRVEGNGTIGHTAIHYDTTSRPNATAFSEYRGGAVYPDNGPPTTSGAFPLPGTFCAQLRDLGATTYLRAHALAPGTPSSQALSAEKVVPVGPAGNVTFANGFREIAMGDVPVCWSVRGLTGTTTHTAIHWDTTSRPNGTFSAYAGGAYYPNNTAPNAVNASLPGDFCANVTMPESGRVYLRAHVISDGAHHHGEERVVEVASRLSVTGGLPPVAAAGSTVEICWRAEGTGSTTHTALHWDDESHPDSTSFADYAGGALYPANAAPTGGPWSFPGPFCANATMPASGGFYFRPHAIFEGVFSDLGPEYAIRVA